MQRDMTPISNPLSPKLEAMLKRLTTPQLVDLYQRQATNPVPDLKLTMILGELNNREDLNKSVGQMPTSTVAQDIVQSAAPRPMPQAQGIQQLQQPAPQAQPQQPPVQTAQAEPGIDNLPVPDTMFTAAGGGIVAFEDGGEVEKYDEDGVRKYAAGDPVVSNPYFFNPSAPGTSTATMKYRNALQNTELSRIMDYVGAGLGDLATILGKFGYDYDHYKATGELKRKSETMGFFPRSGKGNVEATRAAERTAREAGIDQRLAAERAQFDQYLQQAPNVNTPRAGGQTPAAGPEAFPFVADPAMRRALTAQNAKQLDIASIAPPAGAGGADKAGAGGAGDKAGIVSANTPATRFQMPILQQNLERIQMDTPEALGIDAVFKQQNDALRAAGIDPDYFSKRKTAQEERLAETKGDREKAKWFALSEFGFRLAGSKSPFVGQAAGEAGIGALQSYGTEMKDIKKREDALKDAIEKGEDAQQLLKRNEAKEAVAVLREREKDIRDVKKFNAQLDADRNKTIYTNATELYKAGLSRETSLLIAKMQADTSITVQRMADAAKVGDRAASIVTSVYNNVIKEGLDALTKGALPGQPITINEGDFRLLNTRALESAQNVLQKIQKGETPSDNKGATGGKSGLDKYFTNP